MSTWKALLGRVTLFPGPPSSVPLPSALDLYRRVWHGDPDSFQSSINALMPTVANGKREGLTVGCSVHPMRIDFTVNPVPTTREDGSAVFALIEDTSQLNVELLRLIDFIARDDVTVSVSRVGLFLHFLTLTATIKEANNVLSTVIPDQYRPRITDEEDFIFQINRPRLSPEVNRVKLNHITKWSMDRFQVFNIAIAMGAPVVDSRNLPSQQGQDFVAASVVLDLNNVPVQEPLSHSEQFLLLTECHSAAKEMQREFGLIVEGF